MLMGVLATSKLNFIEYFILILSFVIAVFLVDKFFYKKYHHFSWKPDF